MNEVVFQIGQRVISPDGIGEIIEIIRDKFIVKHEMGGTKIFSAEVIIKHHNIDNGHKIFNWPSKMHYRTS